MQQRGIELMQGQVSEKSNWNLKNAWRRNRTRVWQGKWRNETQCFIYEVEANLAVQEHAVTVKQVIANGSDTQGNSQHTRTQTLGYTQRRRNSSSGHLPRLAPADMHQKVSRNGHILYGWKGVSTRIMNITLI